MCCQISSHWLVRRIVSPGSGRQLTVFSSWISEFLSFLWFVFVGTLLGNWKRLFQALLTRFQLKLEPHTRNCKRRWPAWTSRIHRSLGLWPGAQWCATRQPLLCHPPPGASLLLPAWLSRRMQTAHYCSPCFPHSLPAGGSFWNELFHSISIPRRSTHRNVSHHVPHSMLFSSFQSRLQPGCLCVDHSHLMDTQPWTWFLGPDHALRTYQDPQCRTFHVGHSANLY